MYRPADTSFVINVGSKRLRPIRISLPEPPRLHLIDGWGQHPDDQYFKRLEIPERLVRLEKEIMSQFKDKNRGINGNSILSAFWEELENRKKHLEDEINFMKKVVWHMWYGYWVYIDGKPTYIPPWYFSYLNFHRMTLKTGYGYPEYRERNRLFFLARHYLFNTTETFADYDKNGIAIKTPDEEGNMRYRMLDTGHKLFVGTIEPKGRREGRTNEGCHILRRIMGATRGADKLGTIVSMGGENAETHFRQKLIPAWNAEPLWIRPVWIGGFGKFRQLEFRANGLTDVDTLDTLINFTDSADDLANDGKMLIGGVFDEQGKGKRTGNVQDRWNVNKEAMTLGGGSDVIGWSIHPSTVEKMEEGGKDYKDMCDLSNFYKRGKDGQTDTGLALLYLRSSYGLEGYMDKWGQPVLFSPTERQIRNGYKERLGSVTHVENKRRGYYDENDPKKMEQYRSYVRKHPEDYDECWTGVAGQLGLDNEKIRKQKLQLLNKSRTVPGELVWADKSRFVVRFVERADGRWIVAEVPSKEDANQISTMEQYSAIEDEDVIMNRPAYPNRYMIGMDIQQFSNKAEAVHIESKGTKLSDTAIAVFKRRDKHVDTGDDPKTWRKHFVASFRARLSSNIEATDELMKAMIFWGSLVSLEQNRTDIWEKIVEKRFAGYLNFNVEMLADGQYKIASKPGTFLTPKRKKDGFTFLADYVSLYCENEPIYEFLDDLDQISSMEELTKHDRIAAHMHALIGDDSIYADLLDGVQVDQDSFEVLGANTYTY